MRYCGSCGEEYQDAVTECADCGGKELLTADEMRARGRIIHGETDTRRFVRAGTVEDPLSAEQCTSALEAAGISVFARARRAGSVDTLTSGSTLPWWEVLVPEEHLAKAQGILKDTLATIEANSADAARAAEEEEAEGEKLN